MYPRLIFDSAQYEKNLQWLKEAFDKRNFTLMVITKVYCGDPKIAKIAAKYADFLGDSRIENIMNMEEIDIQKALIRIPMISELPKVVKYADISFHSEIKTLTKLNEEAKRQNKQHKVVIMRDLGDLREGFFDREEFFEAISHTLTLENLELFGIAVNLSCFGAILPDENNMQQLADDAKEIEKRFRIKLPFVSGGNSSSLPMLFENRMPEGINNLRIGDSLVLGYDIIDGKLVENLEKNVFSLACEIIELKEKPSTPIGQMGKDAFGEVPVFVEEGIRKKGIIAIGRQDIYHDTITPKDKRIKILGASSDHLVLDLTETKDEYDVGSIVDFELDYTSLLKAFTSVYVKKEYI